ncbi:MAG: hypothetical protein QOH28_3121 [Actinomycetota bacterium]|nr:hypothetical protein [Actinomycetota bacterium]
MSDMRDALNELARRGAPRGFDEVLKGAASAERDAAERDAAARDAGGDDLDTIPLVTAEPVARRQSLSSMIAAAGVAALVLVGTFAVSAVVGSGGAGSAEAAVRRLADAVSHEDILAAADVLAPEEVRSLHGTLDHAARKAAELQLVQTASAPLAGVDFNIHGLNLSTESLGNGYAKVTIDAGTFTAATHKTQFSPLMQKVLRESDDNSSQSDLAKLAENDNLPTFVVAVRHDGRWYVSAAYTVLEYVREYNRVPAADFGSGERNISTLGAESPDAAVQDSMRALQREDWSKLISMAPPSEIPVYDYRDALTTLARRNKAESDRSTSGFTIDSMSTASQVNGDTAKVTLTASGTTDSGHWSLDGGCFVGPSDEDFPYPCGGDPVYFGLVGTPLSGLDKSSTVTVVKQNGRWFVSPVSTVLDVLDHFISQLDRRSLFTLLDIPNQIPPDGPLTLGRPIVLPAGTSQGTKVFTFQGHEGQNLLGLATAQSKPSSTASSYENYPPAAVRMFAPDGSEFGESGMLDGQSLTLPSNGTYTVVVQRSYLSRRVGDVTVTIWDAADAPAAAKQPHDGGSSCTYTLLGASCSSTSSGSSSSIDRILPGNNSGQPSTNDRRVTATSVARGPSPTFAIPTTVPHG